MSDESRTDGASTPRTSLDPYIVVASAAGAPEDKPEPIVVTQDNPQQVEVEPIVVTPDAQQVEVFLPPIANIKFSDPELEGCVEAMKAREPYQERIVAYAQRLNRRDSAFLGTDTTVTEAKAQVTPQAELVEHQRAADRCAHSKDFRSVRWFGNDYDFTGKQADCVSEWWSAWENGTPDVGDETVLLEVKAGDKARVCDLFKGHSAWGTMVATGRTKGTHRLHAPEGE